MALTAVGDWAKAPAKAKRANSVITAVYTPVAPSGSRPFVAPAPGATTPSGPTPEQIAQNAANAAAARANAEGKSRSRAANQATRDLAEGQYKLLGSFAAARDAKLGNIERAFSDADSTLLANYSLNLKNLLTSASDNDKSEADTSSANVRNAVRERSDLLEQAALQGAGETDLLRTQMQAFRNFDANQSENARSYFDTVRSINSAISGMNTDVSTSRSNLFNQKESDRESAFQNYYNQTADTWTQIQNIENSNTNVDSESSEKYNKLYGNAADEAAKAAAGAYTRQGLPAGWTEWEGKGKEQEKALTTSNKAAVVNLGAPPKKAEGATLRKW